MAHLTESETEKNFEKVFKTLDVGDSVKQSIFYSGQVSREGS